MNKTKILKMILVSLLVLFFLQSCKEKPEPYEESELDVPYVSTPMEVVDEMFRLAEFKEGDILLDMGCGDGRIPINAALKYEVKGYGVDLNPERIRESIQNAHIAGVDHLAEFYEQNLFDTDLQEATVITMYLLPSVNLRLRPKIFKQAKPGTRIISHDFNMNEWVADKDSMIFVGDESHVVYYWVVPANISGEWDLLLDDKSLEVKISFNQVFQFAQGNVNPGKEGWKVIEEKLNGDKISFKLQSPEFIWAFNGEVKGEVMRGNAGKGVSSQKVPWEAVRKPGTKKPLDAASE